MFETIKDNISQNNPYLEAQIWLILTFWILRVPDFQIYVQILDYLQKEVMSKGMLASIGSL